MTKKEYHSGKPGRKYGVFNTVQKCFQFGIKEDTPMLAEARLFQKIGDDARKWRFEIRALPLDGLSAKITIIDELHTANQAQKINEIKAARAQIAKAGQYRDLDIIGWETLITAADALDRLTPEKPIETEGSFGDRELCCPNCIGPVTNYWSPGTTPKHCQFCGQALDWEEGGAKV